MNYSLDMQLDDVNIFDLSIRVANILANHNIKTIKDLLDAECHFEDWLKCDKNFGPKSYKELYDLYFEVL